MVLMISARDAAGLIDADAALGCVRHTLEAWADGRGGLSTPRSQYVGASDPPTRFHVKGACLADEGVAGFRINGIPGDPAPAAPTQVMVLCDLATAVPFAVVASDGLSALRVGAMAALTVAALRAKGARAMTVIGAGRLARAVVWAVQASCAFKAVRVASRSRSTAQAMCDELWAAGCPDVEAKGDVEEACRGADVIVTCTNANEALVRAAWCRAGSLLISIGSGLECQADAILDADKIYVDDWQQCLTLGDLAVLAREGRIGADRITGSLANIIAGSAVGRDTEEERIVAVPQGMAILDIALGHLVYQKACQAKVGTQFAWQ